MLTCLKYFRILCLALLAVSFVISTRWIFNAYLKVEDNTTAILDQLNWISWYATAPLLVFYLVVMGIERLLTGTEK